jgi:transposase
MTDPRDVRQILAAFTAEYDTTITAAEAAAIAKVPKKTIYDWSSRGLLNGFKAKPGRWLLLLRDPFVCWLFGLKLPQSDN